MNTEALAEFQQITDQHLREQAEAAAVVQVAAELEVAQALERLRAAGSDMQRWLAAEAAHRQAAEVLAARHRHYVASTQPLTGAPGAEMRAARADLGQLLLEAGGQS